MIAWPMSLFMLAAISAQDSVRVEVPQLVELEKNTYPLAGENLELALSSWTPDHLKLKTRSRGYLNLESKTPSLGLNYLSGRSEYASTLQASFFAGISYLQMSPSSNESSPVHIIIGKLGSEMVPNLTNFGWASLFGRACLMPSGVLASSSLLADEMANFTMPLEISAGVFFRAPYRETLGLPSGLQISYSQTFSAFGKENLSGYGFNLGLRVSI